MAHRKTGDVIVVNTKDEWLGTMPKNEAHEKGVLHRAFSIFILNDKNEMLIQQRAKEKYHSGGLWANACCSHPYPGESTLAAAHRRIAEEMGFDCMLEPVFSFLYKADVGQGMTEHEFDHIYTGHYNGIIAPEPTEVAGYQYINIPDLLQWMQDEPKAFTPWFHILLPKFLEAEAMLKIA